MHKRRDRHPSIGVSIRAYARHRGVSDTAVRKAIATGRITCEPDGTVDVQRADVDWARHTPSSRMGQRSASSQTRPRDKRAMEEDTSPLSTEGISLLQARTVNEVVKAKTNSVRLSRLKGRLLDRDDVVAHVFTLARVERDAWLNWPARVSAPLAATLKVSEPVLFGVLEQAVREHLHELAEFKVSALDSGASETD